MLSIKEIRYRLKDSNLVAVAKSSGISYRVLYKFITTNIDPKHSTVMMLSDYLMSLVNEENENKNN